MNTLNAYQTQYANARKGIWFRAQRSANPKGTILQMQAMNGKTTPIMAYNEALQAAKAWAKGTAPKAVPQEKVQAPRAVSTLMTRLQLRVCAKKLGLVQHGSKDEIVARIQAA
jgi:hypothetical protein